ncbi:MAG: type II toxin-antitoxin system HicB family antitoxin, partial [Chitinispirillaceae bacterium]
MKIKVIMHKAQEGGYWAEVPALPGCVSQGESYEELLKNINEAIEAALSVDESQLKMSDHDELLEVTI